MYVRKRWLDFFIAGKWRYSMSGTPDRSGWPAGSGAQMYQIRITLQKRGLSQIFDEKG